MRGYPQHFYGPRHFAGGFGMLCALLIIGLLVYLVVLARRDRDRDRITPADQTSPAPPAPGAGTPADIVRIRYARGEITREEYETMRKDLE